MIFRGTHFEAKKNHKWKSTQSPISFKKMETVHKMGENLHNSEDVPFLGTDKGHIALADMPVAGITQIVVVPPRKVQR